MATIKWTSAQGITFEFGIYDPNAAWTSHAGLYMFCSVDAAGVFWPKYIGQCDSFCDRFSQHERWTEAVRAGATKVLAVVVPNAPDRDKLERILIQELQPPLNKQLRR